MGRLDATDAAILRRLADAPVDVDALAGAFGTDGVALRDRLAVLRDAGLVTAVDEPDGALRLTVDGRRVVAAPGTGTADDRIDTPPAVECEIVALGLPPDAAAALRAAYVFLAFWGDATAAEIGDALFAAHPAGFVDAAAWWRDLVRGGLTHLPGIRAPTGPLWRYEGDPEASSAEDGRHVAGAAAVGSVRHGVDHLGGSPEERTAVRAAFAALYGAGELTAGELTDAVYADHPAGHDTAAALWADCVRPGLASLPHVHPGAAGETWRYDRRTTASG